MRTLLPAVFLDRDGTINSEKNYLYQIEHFELLPGAGEGIALLNQAGYHVIVVSNQSGVGRGYYSETDVNRLHQHLDLLLTHYGAKVDAYYYCPHHPEHGQGAYRQECICRKPLPGMIFQAAAEHHIDLMQSYMVGDKLIDIEAGKAAGCQTILVQTGYGAEIAQQTTSIQTCNDLLAAAKHITSNMDHTLNL